MSFQQGSESSFDSVDVIIPYPSLSPANSHMELAQQTGFDSDSDFFSLLPIDLLGNPFKTQGSMQTFSGDDSLYSEGLVRDVPFGTHLFNNLDSFAHALGEHAHLIFERGMSKNLQKAVIDYMKNSDSRPRMYISNIREQLNSSRIPSNINDPRYFSRTNCGNTIVVEENGFCIVNNRKGSTFRKVFDSDHQAVITLVQYVILKVSLIEAEKLNFLKKDSHKIILDIDCFFRQGREIGMKTKNHATVWRNFMASVRLKDALNGMAVNYFEAINKLKQLGVDFNHGDLKLDKIVFDRECGTCHVIGLGKGGIQMSFDYYKGLSINGVYGNKLAFNHDIYIYTASCLRHFALYFTNVEYYAILRGLFSGCSYGVQNSVDEICEYINDYEYNQFNEALISRFLNIKVQNQPRIYDTIKVVGKVSDLVKNSLNGVF